MTPLLDIFSILDIPRYIMELFYVFMEICVKFVLLDTMEIRVDLSVHGHKCAGEFLMDTMR